MVRHDEGVLTQRAVPGPALYYVAAAPEGAPRAAVGLLHGYADHAARYAHVMDAWAERGIATVAIDMRGHGRAAGTRGFCRRFDEFLDDASEVVRLTSDRARGAPTYLFGHSFGGVVASLSAITEPRSWRGLILSNPYFGLAMEVPRAKVIAGKIASRIAPKLALPTGLKGKDVTHDAARAKSYDEDPLVFKNATARWFTETTKAQDRVMARARELTMPLYMLVGNADSIAKVSAARRFFDAAGSSDKTWNEQEGLYHEPLNEPSWPDLARSIGDWILSHST